MRNHQHVYPIMPAARQTWKLSSNRQVQASWFFHRMASSLMRIAIGLPRPRKLERAEFIAVASFDRIRVITRLSWSLLILFSQHRVASTSPLSWRSKTRNHAPVRNDLALNFITRPRVSGVCCSSTDSWNCLGIVHWSHGGAVALPYELSADC